MKSRSFISILHILMLSGLLLFIVQPISNVHGAGNPPALPIRELLNTDGTLNLTTGYSGAVDAGNYNVHLDPLRGPIFSPLMTVNAWSSLGGGLNNIVYAIAISGSNVYMGGQFTDAGGNPNADGIAKWNGSSWSALGSGINGQVNALAFNGSVLYVGGNFTNAGGVSGANYIAQWDGTSWATLGDGLSNTVNAISVTGLNIYIAGNFSNAGVDVNADYIAKLDGGTWAALGATPLTGPVNTIAVAGSFVYAGGDFLNVGGNPNIARIALWDGTSWSPLGSGVGATVVSIALSGSDVYVAGLFNDAGGNPNADKIAKWDGTTWSALGSGLNSFVNNVVVNGSNIYAGGNFLNAGGDANADYIARWDGTTWSALGTTPLNNTVSAIAFNGLDVYVGGIFNDAGGDSNGDKIVLFQLDGAAPTVLSFNATSPTNSLNIPITAFTASDNVAVTGYKITEDNTPPTASDAGWTVSAPSTYSVASAGSYSLYPWVKDAMGNISNVYGSPASVTVDTSVPTVNTFAATSPSTSLNIPITAFTAADNVGVTGYKITETSTAPLAGSGGWTVSSPTTYTVTGDGSYTLYPWAKDAAGNVSATFGAPASITVDTTAPTTTSFTRQTPSASTTNADVLVFRVTFSEAVSGVGPADFAVTGTTAAVDSISFVSSGVYDVHIDGTNGFNDGNLVSYNGIVGLDFSGSMVIKDLAGNNLANSEPATDETYTLDNTPTVTPTSTETTIATITTTPTITETATETETPTAIITATATETETETPTVTQTTTPTPTLTSTPAPVSILLTSVAAQDGWVLESSETSGVGGTSNAGSSTFNLGDDATKKQYRGLLSFKTSSIPDAATIISVILKVKQSTIVGGGNPVTAFQGFMVDIKPGFFGTSTLQTSDFQTQATKTYGPFKPKLVGGWYSISLTGGKAYINKLTSSGGLTQIRLRFKLDDNNNVIANYLSLFSGNAPAASRPQLVITYSLP